MKSGNTTAQLKARNGRRQASFDPKKDSDAREKALVDDSNLYKNFHFGNYFRQIRATTLCPNLYESCAINTPQRTFQNEVEKWDARQHVLAGAGI